MTKYLTEFIGTFFLVLIVGLAATLGSSHAPLAIGAGLMVMVYMGGHISGAHYNPAVTLAALMCGKIARGDVVPYLVAQFAGAIAASAVSTWLLGQTFAPAPGPDATGMQALAVEILFTFALCLVVLNVATAKKTAGNSYYGLAIGFTVLAAAYAGGPISGGAFNPAVGLGPILVKAIVAKGSLANVWLYLVGPGLGAVAASRVFSMQET